MSPLYTYLILRAKSVFAAVFLHSLFNSIGQVAVVYTSTDSKILSELVAFPVGLIGILTFSVIALLIYLMGTPNLTRDGLS